MKTDIKYLEYLFSEYTRQFEKPKRTFKSYLSDWSLVCYHRENAKGNKVYRYSIRHGYGCETNFTTRIQMIRKLEAALDAKQPLTMR